MDFSLAINCGKNFKVALSKFIKDGQILNEIDDRADKELFLPLANQGNCIIIESIKEDDIYDSFVHDCIKQNTYFNVRNFVEEKFMDVTESTKKDLYTFFEGLRKIIFEVLSIKCSLPDTKLILSNQDQCTEKIIEAINKEKTKEDDQKPFSTIVIQYCANMQGKKWDVGCYEKAIADKKIQQVIDLSSNGVYQPQDADCYWNLERNSLISKYNKFLPILEENKNYSIFGLAPIPLLILLGHLFSSRSGIDIYNLHKSSSSWEWGKVKHDLDIITENHVIVKDASEAILVLSFSGKINIRNILKSIDLSQFTIMELSLATPYDDWLDSKEQLAECMNKYRKAKEHLLSMGIQKIHLFAAIPPAFAISIGQAYNANYDPILVTYEFCKGTYTKALTIGDIE